MHKIDLIILNIVQIEKKIYIKTTYYLLLWGNTQITEISYKLQYS